MKNFGLIGKTLSHSFSKNLFESIWDKNGFENKYHLIELDNCSELANNIDEFTLNGFNITNPFKEDIISLVNKLDKTAQLIGSVNCVNIKNGQLIGYNTDATAFEKCFKAYVNDEKIKCLILGSGGVSKAVQYALNNLGLDYKVVSRKNFNLNLSYENLDEGIIRDHQCIINCTPLGIYPISRNRPNIPYQFLSSKHLLIDLVYNPSLTYFLRSGLEKGCSIMNGYQMLVEQALISWQIWNDKR